MHLPILILIFIINLIPSMLWSQNSQFDNQQWVLKQHRDELVKIVDQNIDSAIDSLQEFLQNDSSDLEALFLLAIAYSEKNEITKAMNYVKQAVAFGLPIERFLSGPRNLLGSLYDSAEFKTFVKSKELELLHGPMIGCVTDSSAKFWVRTIHEVPVQILIKEFENSTVEMLSSVVRTKHSEDYTAVISINGLKPSTKYSYQLIVDNQTIAHPWSFRTFPDRAKGATFTIGFGGGAAYTPQHERMWNTIAAHDLAGFLFLGDNVYIDNPTRPAVQRYCYYRRQSRPEYRQFTASTPIYAIWDDHDFTTNDGWGGPEMNIPAWKIPVWQVFRENWNNPYYGGNVEQPGCWFDFSIADVDFFMLDGRYYRTAPQSSNPSMLGQAQKEWLFNKLKNSKAAFKVIASPVPWASGAKPGSLDTWDGYAEERDEIFSFIATHAIEGVLLLSADRHRSDVWKIYRPKGYHLYDFESSRLTNIHFHKQMPEALFSYNAKCSFGLLKFDTNPLDPTVTYQIINIDNEIVHEFSLYKSQLTMKSPGQLEWERLVSEKDLKHPAFAYIEDDPNLSRVLLIGNSISIGYTVPVQKFLAGKANVHRIPENGGDTRRGLEKLDSWLGKQKWDVIHFNWGLHDLKYLKDGKYDITGEQVATLEEYEKNLEELIRRLKATKAKLIWATTTPVPDSSIGRFKGDEIKFNEVANRVMKKHGVDINDLHTYILPYIHQYQRHHNVHFIEEGYQVLGEQVGEKILEALNK